MPKEIISYRKACDNLVKKFVKKYFTYDDDSVSDYYIIGRDSLWHLAPHAFCVWDLYYNIEEAYEALYSDLPREKVIDRADPYYERPKGVSFHDYCKYWKTPEHVYTDEERSNDLKNIRNTYEQLLKSMWVTKTKDEVDEFMKQIEK